MSRPPLRSIGNLEARQAEFEHRVRTGGRAVAAEAILEALGEPYPPLRHSAALTASDWLDAGDAPFQLADALRRLAAGEADAAQAAEPLGVRPDRVAAPEAQVRQAACLALRGDHSSETVALLRRLTSDDDADVRYQALVGLHHQGVAAETIRPLVVERLEDEDVDVAVVAAQIAAASGWDDLFDALRERWQAGSGDARFQFALAVGELSATSGQALPADEQEALTAELIAGLEDEETLAAAAKALSQLGEGRAREPLRGIIGKWLAHPILKVEAAAALVRLGDDEGRVYLDRALQSRRKDARGYALRVVGRLGLTDYFDTLAATARSDDYHADTAVLALADLGGDEAQAVLAEVAAEHPDDEVRALARDLMER